MGEAQVNFFFPFVRTNTSLPAFSFSKSDRYLPWYRAGRDPEQLPKGLSDGAVTLSHFGPQRQQPSLARWRHWMPGPRPDTPSGAAVAGADRLVFRTQAVRADLHPVCEHVSSTHSPRLPPGSWQHTNCTCSSQVTCPNLSEQCTSIEKLIASGALCF